MSAGRTAPPAGQSLYVHGFYTGSNSARNDEEEDKVITTSSK